MNKNTGKNVETAYFTCREVTTADAERIKNLVANASQGFGEVERESGAFKITYSDNNSQITYVIETAHLTTMQKDLLDDVLVEQVKPKK